MRTPLGLSASWHRFGVSGTTWLSPSPPRSSGYLPREGRGRSLSLFFSSLGSLDGGGGRACEVGGGNHNDPLALWIVLRQTLEASGTTRFSPSVSYLDISPAKAGGEVGNGLYFSSLGSLDGGGGRACEVGGGNHADSSLGSLDGGGGRACEVGGGMPQRSTWLVGFSAKVRGKWRNSAFPLSPAFLGVSPPRRPGEKTETVSALDPVPGLVDVGEPFGFLGVERCCELREVLAP